MKKLKTYSITKQDIQDALQSVLREFKDLEKKGIHCPVPYSKISPHVGFTRGTKNWGRCSIKAHTGNINILVGRKFLSGYLSHESLRSTLIHEIIHTLPDCQNHGPDFQYWARLLSREMNTDIGTYANNEESVQGTRGCFEESKNVLVCVDCGEPPPLKEVVASCFCRQAERQTDRGLGEGVGLFLRSHKGCRNCSSTVENRLRNEF